MNEFSTRVLGIPECKAALLALVPKLRKRILRNALATGARIYRDEAKRLTPLLKKNTPTRTRGTVQKAISVRTSKASARNGDIGVFVNVRPAKGAKYKTTKKAFFGIKYKTRTLKRTSQRGANSPTDPFYWRFLEFGTKKLGKKEFLTNAVKKTGDVTRKIAAALTKSLSNINTPGGTK